MRQIVLDTETTGLEPSLGHRIIEIGCVELINRRSTGRTFHRYLNPERDIDGGALAVHGISRRVPGATAALRRDRRGARRPSSAAPSSSSTTRPSTSASSTRSSRGCRRASRLHDASSARVLDTLALARELHPGQRNSLDALCKRYGVDNSRRELHGALLDARILADVYLAMTGGQGALDARTPMRVARDAAARRAGVRAAQRRRCACREATAEERAAHEATARLLHERAADACVWRPRPLPVPRRR